MMNLSKSNLLVSALIVVLMICNMEVSVAQNQLPAKTKKELVPGEQAPLANPNQNSFGGIRKVGTTKQKRLPWPARPEPKIQTVSLDEISMSDPFVFPDETTKTYYLTGTGGRLYKSKDLKMWTGPYKIIDLTGTWMDSLWVAAAEIHQFGDKYYLAGTWSDHTTLIEAVPRRYNVPLNQTQLLVADSPEGPYKPLVINSIFAWALKTGILLTELCIKKMTPFIWFSFMNGPK